MSEIDDINNIIEYFRKLNRVIAIEADISFLGFKLIKKNKIDDILCCILATLPDTYKRLMKSKEGKKLSTVLAYNLLFKNIKQKFILNPNVYLIHSDNVTKYINTIIRDIEKDFAYAQKNAF